MRKVFLTIGLFLAFMTAAAQTYNYDVNNDGLVSIIDVAYLVNKILGVPNPGEEQQPFLTCPDDQHPHLIDLDLPSGTKWACCNVGAEAPEGFGGYYAWGEREEKVIYDESTYIFGYGGSGGPNSDREMSIGGTEFDVAYMEWGHSWSMPSSAQVEELLANCSSEWTTLNGVSGRRFYGDNGNSIFLPAAGMRIEDSLSYDGKSGFYWSSTLTLFPQDKINSFSFDSENYAPSSELGHYGLTVRPVGGVLPTLSTPSF